jgi:hypothetical protein
MKWGWSKKKILEKNKPKWPILQNGHFLKWPIFKLFLWKFHGLVLGLVGLIDVKGIDVAQPIWSRGCPTQGQKQPKTEHFVFLGCFYPYVKQPHNHIGWAISVPLASINPTNQRTNPWNFHCEKNLRICHFEKWPFWKIGRFGSYFPKKFFFLIPIKMRLNLCGRMVESKL